ncbi:hypothetical protein LCM23_14675 [Cytobacillus kochii]|uniref:hypothetical protein n=1 Tax=Cytobacillus kochii TaxID=859143 RepID=UPI001CD5E305|nr:hypothetical protein [Cytobacillus kochii]MCA1027342.1 hypothetical protein [Cytobacillus kochii]
MGREKVGYLLKNEVLRDEDGNILTDKYGRPVTDYIPVTPFEIRSWQPYSPQMASDRYAIRVPEVNYRFFTDPNDILNFNERFQFKGKTYRIEYPIKFDRHYQVLVKEIE